MSEDLPWMPAWRLRDLIADKQVSPTEVTEHFLARIEEFQPTLKAYTNIDRDGALVQAREAESALLAGAECGPLHGVPVAAKAHIDIAGLPRAGAPFWFGEARRDDVTVERLRAAGAVVLGHNAMPVMTPTGAYDWSALPRNPWDPERVPGVSTAGGATAVAAGLAPVVLGSDGGGSCRLPSAYTGVFGLHPTAGLVPWVDHKRWAVRPGTTIGPLSRDVRDAALMLAVVAGPDGRDHLGLKIDLPDPRSELDLGAEGLRLAWTDDFGFAGNYAVEETPRVVSRIRESAFAFASLGALVEETTEQWEDYTWALNVHRGVFTDMPVLGPEAGASISEADWDAASDLRQRTWQRFRRLFRDYDLLLSPTLSSVAPTFERWEKWWSGPTKMADGVLGMDGFAIHTAMFNWLGFPAASVPCGLVDGLPVGLQIIGPPGSDARILRAALAFQQQFPLLERPQVS